MTTDQEQTGTSRRTAGDRRGRVRRIEVVMGLALSVQVAACSSKDAAEKTLPDPKGDAGPRCRPDPSLAAHRDGCEFPAGAAATETIGNCTGKAIPIEHVVLIVQENRSFDQYFGHLPGHGQDDVDVPPEGTDTPAPGGVGWIPWHHEPAYCLTDTDHGWSASHTQWNQGRNDGFAITNVKPADPTGARAMGYYDQTDIPYYYDLASTFAISDRYYCSLLGPTYPNRLFFFAGTSFGSVTTDLTAGIAPPGAPMVLKELDDKGVSWKVYKTNLASPLLFIDYATDPSRADHFVAAEDFVTDAAAGTLPQVSLVDSGFSQDPWIETDEHPPADMQLGQRWVYDKVKALTESPLWPSSALFLTYDEHGGLYDHVSPPAACVPDDTPPKQGAETAGFDRLGFRVPVVVVSPYAKRHFVSHEVHSHTSILRFLQAKFDLPALTNRDANSDAMLDFFDFEHKPNLAVPEFTEPDIDASKLADCKTAFAKTPPATTPDAGP